MESKRALFFVAQMCPHQQSNDVSVHFLKDLFLRSFFPQTLPRSPRAKSQNGKKKSTVNGTRKHPATYQTNGLAATSSKLLQDRLLLTWNAQQTKNAGVVTWRSIVHRDLLRNPVSLLARLLGAGTTIHFWLVVVPGLGLLTIGVIWLDLVVGVIRYWSPSSQRGLRLLFVFMVILH